jgi:hypothetical protein
MLRSLNQEEQIGVQTPFNYTKHELLSCLHKLCSIVTEEILFSSCPTSSNALRWHAIRQEAQEGLVQVQTVAPRSIKAQLRSPGLIASTNCCASIQKSLIAVEWAFSFTAIVQSQHKTQMKFPSTTGTACNHEYSKHAYHYSSNIQIPKSPISIHLTAEVHMVSCVSTKHVPLAV